MKIWFDMDGTIADLYGVENWLDYLLAEDATPYKVARPLLNLSLLARYLNRLQKEGYEIGIISWGAKNSTKRYLGKVTFAKLNWLDKHLASVRWDVIKIVPYGTDKAMACGGGILFDDEARNREGWNGDAYTPEKILETLKNLLTIAA